MAKFNLSEDYLNHAGDAVANTPRATMRVTYALSCRRGGMLCGVADIVDLLTDHCQGPVTLRGKTDGERFAAGESALALEGAFADLVALETLCSGILALSAGAGNMAALVEAAGDSIKVVDTSARRHPPELIAPLAVAAAVGGAWGTSTQAGQAAAIERFGTGGDQIRVGQRSAATFALHGSVPAAMASIFAGNCTDGAAAFHAACPQVALNVSLGFEGRERDTCASAALRFGTGLEAVRLDTPPDRIHQSGHEQAARALEMRILSQATDRPAATRALEKYGFGPGVTIEAVYGIRDLLDSLGARSTRIIVAGGFDAQKVQAFRACQAPMDIVEADGWVEFADFTCEIVRVLEDGQWVNRRRAGAGPVPMDIESLPVIFEKQSRSGEDVEAGGTGVDARGLL